MIKLDILDKKYENKIVFYDTKIEINEGEMVCIKGKSGSGKSTLLSIIGLLENFNGTYFLFNEEIKDDKEKVRCDNFAYMFQNPMLIPYLNVKDNVLLPLKNLGEEINETKFHDVMKILDISDLEIRSVNTLSGGEAQRVSLARALLSSRKILLCDEPTGSLDPDNAKIVMDKLKEINKNYHYTVIMVTHSNDFDSYFDKIYRIMDKKVVLQNEKE